jgi:hypothetical protein
MIITPVIMIITQVMKIITQVITIITQVITVLTLVMHVISAPGVDAHPQDGGGESGRRLYALAHGLSARAEAAHPGRLELTFEENERGKRACYAARRETGAAKKGDYGEIYSAAI